jgi:hypothetical protein
MADRYFIALGAHGPEREVTRAEFIAAEQAAGFRSKSGPDTVATGGFSDGRMRGRVVSVPDDGKPADPPPAGLSSTDLLTLVREYAGALYALGRSGVRIQEVVRQTGVMFDMIKARYAAAEQAAADPDLTTGTVLSALDGQWSPPDRPADRPASGYPSEQPAPIAEPFHGQGDPGWRPGPHSPTDGVQYIAQQLVALGWAEHGAQQWAEELLCRYPHLCHDDYLAVAEVADMLHVTVDDPHDWDSHGAVLNVLEWRWRTR